MKVKEVIEHLQAKGTWVNWDKTRDIVLYGKTDKEITKMGVCWVATKDVIRQAQQAGINFIISHENLFYEQSTSPNRLLLESANEKKAMLDEGDITVYRCHDVWDMMPEYGVADVWSSDIGFDFEPRVVSSYNSYANIDYLTVREVAQKVANAVGKYGQEAIQVFGDLDRKVSRLAIGTGAATNIFSMQKEHPDVCVASDDGVTNWIAVQWCIDNDMPLILVNHASCEIGGLMKMVDYMNLVFPDLQVQYLKEDYQVHSILAKEA
ncbi:MAG: Nif3-like dinuclear metal center hexameric protein [Erysipelotrichaceae bacterium]|nr:Nif3-like dinuclear metal center hexameric protein [Erysipelotrichaceae bacterium]